MAVFGILYLLSAFAATFFGIASSLLGLSITECVWISLPSSVLIASWISLWFSNILPFGLSVVPGIIVPSLIFILFAALFYDKFKRNRHVDWTREYQEWWPQWLCTLLVASFVIPLTKHHYLSIGEHGSYYTGGSTYGDLAFHLQLISSITDGINRVLPFWDWRATIFSGSKLLYPLLVDYVSAVLTKGGFSLQAALWVPSSIMILSSLALMHCLATRFTLDHRVGFIAVLLVACPGGWGFINFYKDWQNSNQNLFKWALTLNHDYVHDQGNQVFSAWFQFFGNVMLPQRTSAAAYPIVIAVLLLLHQAVLIKGSHRKSYFILAGFLAALTPFCLGHAFIGLAIFSCYFMFCYIDLFYDWVAMATVAGVLGGPQMIWFSFKASEWGFISWNPMWTAEPLKFPQALAQSFLPKWAVFWPATLGIFPILAILGIFVLNSHQKKFALGGFVVWMAGTFPQWQPWILDNVKMLYIGYFIMACIVATFIIWIPKKMGKAGILVCVALLILLTISGAIGNLRETTQHYSLFDVNDIEAGNFVKEKTPSGSIFLTAQAHNHPVPCLGGRAVFMSYAGWLWSHGYTVGERQQHLTNMFAGKGTKGLMEKYGLKYVVIGPHERQLNPNESHFENSGLYNRVFRNRAHTIYELK